jgi:hypothetical protein
MKMKKMELELDTILLDINGKDDRLNILNDGMTKYGCHTKPYPHMSYSSCTASTISIEAYTHIYDYIKNNLDIYKDQCTDEFQIIRDSLRGVLGLKDNIDICLSSSGTDLEMLPYAFIPEGSNVRNIIVGVEEVGSGAVLAAEGRFFSEANSDNFSIKKGDMLEGFEKFNIEIVKIPIRDEEGIALSEEDILQRISHVLDSNHDSNVYNIIHSVFHSKTGLIKPSPNNLITLVKNIKNSIIVVDACQFRISRETINQLLEKECIVFITGSKFFTAPTFSAAALIPEKLRDCAANSSCMPSGLNFLFGRELFPKRWNSVNSFEYGSNLGLLLRWKAALFEMQLFNSLSKERIIKTVHIFNQCVQKIEKKYQNIVIYSDIAQHEIQDYDALMSQTILTFGFRESKVDFDMAKKIYKELIENNWLNENFPYSIHLGQPVKVKKLYGTWLGTLRIALSSKFFVNFSGKVEMVQHDIINGELEYIFNAVEEMVNKNHSK